MYPVTFDDPVRIEWFDDEVDSIRPFSVADQRSYGKRQEVLIPPARELFAPQERLFQAGDRVAGLLEARLKTVKDPDLRKKLTETIGWEIEQLKTGPIFTGIYKYIEPIYPDCQSILSYVPKDTVLIMDEPTRIRETARQMEREEAEWQTALLGQGEYLPGLKVSFPYEELFQRIPLDVIYLSLFMRQTPGIQPQNIVQILCRGMQQFHGQMHALKGEWERWMKGRYRVIFTAGTEERAERLIRVLADYGMEVTKDTSENPPAPGHPVVRIGTLLGGFEMSATRLAVITGRGSVHASGAGGPAASPRWTMRKRSRITRI